MLVVKVRIIQVLKEEREIEDKGRREGWVRNDREKKGRGRELEVRGERWRGMVLDAVMNECILYMRVLTEYTAKHWLIFSGSLGRQCWDRAIM